MVRCDCKVCRRIIVFLVLFRDRMRSAANAVSHTFVAAFTYNICKNRLKEAADTELEITVDVEENKEELKSVGTTEVLPLMVNSNQTTST